MMIGDDAKQQFLRMAERKRLAELKQQLGDRRDWDGVTEAEEKLDALEAEFFPRKDHSPVAQKSFSIDWLTAPSWAQYHTFDEVFANYPGEQPPTGRWWSHRPRIYYGKCFWELGSWPSGAQSAGSDLYLPEAVDWKLSLVIRPHP